MKILPRSAAALALLAGLASPAAAQATKNVLTLDGARAVLAAAERQARELGAPGGAIAVVDDGGELLALSRLDGTFAAAARVSTGKARTAALFRKPTSDFETIIVEKGRVSMTALSDFTPLRGGVPIVIDGDVVGAVGVSGAASAQQDDEIAQVAARALSQAPAGAVTHLPRAAVQAAFEKGAPLLAGAAYRVDASRRDGPGEAEVHLADTDIVYVLDGRATLVTGGQVVDGRRTARDEVRGRAIEGGDERRLEPGDVLVVPAGTPHWFRQVDSPFVYYVVKSR